MRYPLTISVLAFTIWLTPAIDVHANMQVITPATTSALVQTTGQSANAAQKMSDPSWRTKAKTFTNRRLLVFGLEGISLLTVVTVIVFSGLAARWRVALQQRLKGTISLRIVYVAGVLALLGLISLPFDLWRYRLDRTFGLSNQTLADWLRDYLISGGISFVFALAAVLGIYVAVRRKPRTWWLWTSAAAIPVIALTFFAGPYVDYLFNSFTPMRDQNLAGQVLRLAQRAGVNAGSVYEVDMSRQTNAVNAYATGLAASKRIVIGDTLIRDFTPAQVQFVTGHEIGHYVMHHTVIGFLMAIASTAILLFFVQQIGETILHKCTRRTGIDDPLDPAGLFIGILITMVLAIPATPLANIFSRYLEHSADQFALELTVPGNVSREEAADAFERLGRLDLSDPDPNPIVKFLLWNHPTIDERKQFALNYRR